MNQAFDIFFHGELKNPLYFYDFIELQGTGNPMYVSHLVKQVLGALGDTEGNNYETPLLMGTTFDT